MTRKQVLREVELITEAGRRSGNVIMELYVQLKEANERIKYLEGQLKAKQ